MRLRHLASVPGGYGSELAFAPDGELWACARSGIIQLWRNTHLLHEIQIPGHAVGPVRFIDDARLLLAGPFLINTSEGQLLPSVSILDRLGFDIHAGSLGPTQMVPQNAVLTPDTTALMVYARYQPPQTNDARYHGPYERVVLLTGHTGQPLAVLWEGNGLLNCRLLDATNTHLAAAGMGVRLWSLSPVGLLAEYPSESTPISALRFSHDGEQLAYANVVGEMVARSVADNTSRNWLADPDGVSSLCFSSGGTRILAGGRKGALTVWANEGEPRALSVHHFSDSVDSVALASSGERLLVALGGGRQSIEFFEIEDHGVSWM